MARNPRRPAAGMVTLHTTAVEPVARADAPRSCATHAWAQ
jgi:hypothetical protein